MILILLIFTLAMASCGDQDMDTSGSPSAKSFVLEATYCQVQNILDSNCISCHSAAKSHLRPSFEAAGFKRLIGTALIRPGASQNSRIFQRITSDDPDIRMPFHKPPLSKEDIELIKVWIDEGANTDC